MRTAILTVGTEILFGQIVNTNAAWLSRELNDLGYDVMYHYTVGDNPQRLHDLIELAFRDCDLILTTGGLGPTQDDLTKEVICQRTIISRLTCHQGPLCCQMTAELRLDSRWKVRMAASGLCRCLDRRGK